MKKFLKGFWLLGGTAVACVACCTVPIFMGPLLTWIGVTSLGFVFSPWYLLLLAIPALLILMRTLHNKTARANCATASNCSCSTMPPSAESSNDAPNKPVPIACTLPATKFKDRAASITQLT